MSRPFAPRCVRCRTKTMELAVVPYDVRMEHDGATYDVHVPELSVPRCTTCGEISLDEEASDQVDGAFRREAGLLTPNLLLTKQPN